MTDNNFRRAYTQARYNERHALIFASQLIVLSLFVGATFDSVAIGIAAFLLSSALIIIPMFGKFMCLVLSAGWAFIGFSVFQDAQTIATPVAVACLAFVVGYGINYSGLLGVTDAF